MRRRFLLLILLSLCVVAASGCRSRKKVPPPQSAPPVATATAPEPAVSVASPERDFVEPQATQDDVLSEDLTEANRVARQRGWIQDAFFHFDAATLDEDAQEALRQSSVWLRRNPAYRLRIEGHCDERGTEQYNLALGDRRADAAVSYLVTLGVDRSMIETVSYGEARPFEERSNETAWAQNRRAHLVLTGRR